MYWCSLWLLLWQPPLHLHAQQLQLFWWFTTSSSSHRERKREAHYSCLWGELYVHSKLASGTSTEPVPQSKSQLPQGDRPAMIRSHGWQWKHSLSLIITPQEDTQHLLTPPWLSGFFSDISQLLKSTLDSNSGLRGEGTCAYARMADGFYKWCLLCVLGLQVQ